MKIHTLDPVWTQCDEEAADYLRNELSYNVVRWEKSFGKARMVKEKGYLIQGWDYDQYMFLTGFVDRALGLFDFNGDRVEYFCDVPDMPFVTPSVPNGEFRPYQLDLIMKALRHGYGTIVAATGCVTGDTVINVNRGGNGRKYTIKQLYNKFNGNNRSEGKWDGRVWERNIPTNVRVYKKDRDGIFLHEIEDVLYSGKQKVWKVTLENGKSISATANHKIMTDAGWVELRNLSNDSLVMCDTLHAKAGNGKGNARYKLEPYGCSLWSHPVARLVPNKKKPWRFDKRHPIHILTYEAHDNGMELEEFLSIVKKRNADVSNMKFVNTKMFHIHHKDGDPYNNDIDNLQKVVGFYHLSDHGYNEGWKNFAQGVPRYSKVTSIEFIGVEDTYDICCKDPHHNFVGNGIVVHNSGKSWIINGIISAYPNARILLLVHTVDLVQQLKTGLIEAGFDPGEYTGKKKEMKRITVATVQSYYKVAPKYSSAWDVVMVDEGHHVGSPDSGTYYKALAYCGASARFAFTATIADKEEQRVGLEGLIGPVIGTLTMEEGTELGFLSVPEIIFRVCPLPDIVYEYPEDPGYTVIYKDGIVNNFNRNLRVITEVEKEVKRGGIVLILVRHIRHIDNIVEYMDIPVDVVKGSVSREDRLKIKNDLKSGRIKCVIATAAWIEGVDCPNLTMVVNAAGGRSKRETLQKIGRGLRKTENKNTVKIIEFMDVRHVERNPFGKQLSGEGGKHILHKQGIERWELYEDQGWKPKLK